MALEISRAELQSFREPFPSDGWYKFKTFEMQDGSAISLYRNGDLFKYRFTLFPEDSAHPIPYKGDPDEMMEILETSYPMKVANKISFVRCSDSFQSKVDPKIAITKEIWSVTLMWTPTSITKCGPCELGHAFILVEKINNIGLLEILRIHIFQRPVRPNKVFICAEVLNVRYNEKWEASDTYLRPAYLVQEMIDNALKQQKDCLDALAQGLPSPILYNSISPNPKEGINNCLSWTLPLLEMVGIIHPITEYWAPGSGYYVPSYHVKPLKIICKRMIDEDGKVKSFFKKDVLSDIEKDQKQIDLKKKNLHGEIASIVPMTAVLACLPIAGWILIPAAVIGMPIMCAIHGYEINKMEKALENKKIENLELTIKK